MDLCYKRPSNFAEYLLAWFVTDCGINLFLVIILTIVFCLLGVLPAGPVDMMPNNYIYAGWTATVFVFLSTLIGTITRWNIAHFATSREQRWGTQMRILELRHYLYGRVDMAMYMVCGVVQWLLIIPYMIACAFALNYETANNMSKGIGLLLWLAASCILFITESINTALTHRIFDYDEPDQSGEDEPSLEA
jgi:hypothetical protein